MAIGGAGTGLNPVLAAILHNAGSVAVVGNAARLVAHRPTPRGGGPAILGVPLPDRRMGADPVTGRNPTQRPERMVLRKYDLPDALRHVTDGCWVASCASLSGLHHMLGFHSRAVAGDW
ncbi:MAG: hypothetical protein JO144_09040 [Actinobacteria bacterium]|nr:hypothetical protein [Actinomycetota bacterium]